MSIRLVTDTNMYILSSPKRKWSCKEDLLHDIFQDRSSQIFLGKNNTLNSKNTINKKSHM